MKYLITVSYDGSKYYGFQRLNDLPSIQKELEDALSVINKDKVYVKGSGRTDRGVHAIGQRCHFELKYDIPCSRDTYYDRYRKFFWMLNDVRE